jgi:hypothetical protein
MGQEIECTVRFQRRTLTGKAYLETDHLLFRGEERLKVALKDLTGVQSAAGVLKLDFAGGPVELELGKAADKWADKILHPPSRADKLGIKAGLAARLVGAFDGELMEDLRSRGAEVAGRGKVDLLFFAATHGLDLARIGKLAAELKPNGALWIVYPKGVATIREMDVLMAGRGAGLKDNKIASFSATHTALKFVIPVAKR